MPFLADHLWWNLVRGARRRCISPAGPRSPSPTRRCSPRSREVRTRRRARPAGARRPPGSSCASRFAGWSSRARRSPQRPRRRDRRRAAGQGRRVRRGRGVRAAGEAEPAGARPEARQGRCREVRAALAEGAFTELEGGRFQVNGHILEPDEVLVERIGREGWAVAADGGVTVALDDGARRRAPARGARERPDPGGAGAAQGQRARDHRPDPPLDPGRGPAARSRTGSPRRRSPSRSSSGPSCGSRRPDEPLRLVAIGVVSGFLQRAAGSRRRDPVRPGAGRPRPRATRRRSGPRFSRSSPPSSQASGGTLAHGRSTGAAPD